MSDCVCLCMFIWQEKITKEMNYILANQDTVLSQITQLESSITQTEVINVTKCCWTWNKPQSAAKHQKNALFVFRPSA